MVLEVTGNAWAIARILEPHVASVVVVDPSETGDPPRARQDRRLDARALAELLAAGALDAVWMPDERPACCAGGWRAARSWSRPHAGQERDPRRVDRRLKGRPPASDLFGKKGRAWLAGLELPVEERVTVDAGLRQIDFLDGELARSSA